MINWIDGHPRVGWYVATLVTIDVFLSLIDVWGC